MLAALLTLTGCARTPALVSPTWFEQDLGREHVLSGRVYHVGEQAFVTGERLLADVRASSVLLLGETHDNPDHHRLQALLLDAFLKAHGPASVAFEMLDETQAPALDPMPKNADELAQRVEWSASGWPDFALYRPVFETALQQHARIVAAHPSREHLRASMHGAPVDLAAALHLEPALAPAATEALAQEIRDAHCGHASPGMVDGMLKAQAFKDAWMARSMARAGAPVVLIAGRGHVYAQRAVPVYLARQGMKQVLSIALLDVDDARTEPAQYELEGFDYVLFTPRTTDESACERFRAQLEQMRHGSPAGEKAP